MSDEDIKELTDLIAMQENLGLGNKGRILITTQERVNENLPAIAQDIIDEDFAHLICNRVNKYDALLSSRNDLAFALGRFGRHDSTCPMYGKYIGGKECDCGYTEVKKALKEAEEIT